MGRGFRRSVKQTGIMVVTLPHCQSFAGPMEFRWSDGESNERQRLQNRPKRRERNTLTCKAAE